MQNNAPRIMIAGTGSGCGKTTVTLAVLRALQRRDIKLAAFKCGPDYIDPMFHKAVLGILSRNLDLFFIDEIEIRSQLVYHIPQDGLGVIEGVMGFYDGRFRNERHRLGVAPRACNRHACAACCPPEGPVALPRRDAGRISELCGKHTVRCHFERYFRGNVPVL